ncbi:MAG: Gfo/Idh/MocA family oxidoreductase, partial [Lentisphaeria bacterium]|nr:Gfo/Idh/MocA family oxidoreductase [Lentisphaeria bacterium]
MKIKIAVAGFRHGHIFSLLSAVKRSDKFELAGCCEEDTATREKLSANLQIDWSDYQKMLNELDCDAVAIGDYYGKRGAMAIAALKAGKHVIADKPLCT